MTELWAKVEGFGNLYEVSNMGNVRVNDREYINNLGRLRRIQGHNVCQGTTDRGYKSVQFHFDGKIKTFMVHRLVAKYFVPNPNNFPEVNHKDENKENNCANNLEWCTRSYNCTYGNGLKKRAEKCSKPVVQIKNGKIISEFESMTEAERKTGVKISKISRCCNGKPGLTAKGYEWRFKNNE